MKDIRITHFEELCLHKKILLDSCQKLATYFLINDNEDFALMLMKRAFVHDTSKLSKAEFHAADAFDSFSKDSRKGNQDFTKKERIFLEIHWKNNKHHPEHWENIRDMKDIDIAEMVCDWHARSVEFDDDLIEYIGYRQKARFAFPDDMYEKIMYYAKILVN